MQVQYDAFRNGVRQAGSVFRGGDQLQVWISLRDGIVEYSQAFGIGVTGEVILIADLNVFDVPGVRLAIRSA